MDASIRQHHREKLIDLNGQLKPLLLEWMTVFHFARSYNASIAWFPVDQSGPEFIARIGEIECEVECKRQSEAIIDLLGRTESDALAGRIRSEEHTSELQSLMRISYAVFCLKKKKSTST